MLLKVQLGVVILDVVVSNSSSLPIYEQIKEQIKEQILSGELSENEMLPSLRQLAKDLRISVLMWYKKSRHLQLTEKE